MKDQLNALFKFCSELGADYCDIRIKEILTESLSVENQAVRGINKNCSKGAGIRLFVGGSLGFAATNDLTKLKETAQKAYEIACASKKLQNGAHEMSEKPAAVGEYQTKIEIDPFCVPLKDKLDLLFSCTKEMLTVEGVSKAFASMSFRKENVIYADSLGSYITQNFCQSSGGEAALSVSDSDAQLRSYPASFGGNYERAGYEYVQSLKLYENAKKTAEESVALLNAEECPSGVYDLIIEPSQLVLQIHESVGHPVELDRVFGSEAAFAGRSFVSPEFLNQNFKYGSEHVTIKADATAKGGLGTFGFDDEGVAAHNTTIIDKGIFKGFLTSRDTAVKIGQSSNGASLSDGWRNLPIVRMTNINLMPGDYELDQLISEVEDGFMLSVNKSWSIDDVRLNFQFACELAYEIKNGVLTGKIFKNPIYAGITPEFWGSCDGVCNEKYWKIYGVPNCGKGQPMQTMRVAHGSAHARFRNVKVGVSDVK